MVFDVGEREFEARVVERSRELPVVVDFWAEWCGPCRSLSPALEAAANRREGDVELAKVDVDSNQGLAAAFGVQGIPAVKAFRDAKIVSQFTGAIPPARVEAFFDELVPSEADRLAGSEDEGELRKALELDPRQVEAARKLGRLLIARGESDEAASLLGQFPSDFVADGLAARLELAESNGDFGAAFSAWDEGDFEAALDALQDEVAEADPEQRDLLRRVMVAIFTELGADHPLAREHRRRLAASL
jgi:putative thioredoxin